MTRERAVTVGLRWETPADPALPEPADPPADALHGATSLEAALLAAARADPGRPAIVEPGGTRTYGDLAAGAAAVAERLAARRGWRPGDRVGLALDASAAYVAAFHGALRAGAVVVPIPPALPAERIETLLDWTECRVRLVESAGAPHDRGSLAAGTGSGGDRPVEEWVLPGSRPLPGPAAAEAPDRPAAIFLTSGSTGPPKGVLLSRGNLLANADAIRRSRLGLRPSDRALLVLPVHHAFGNSVVQSHLLAGSRVVIGGRALSPLPEIERHGITALYEVPDRCVLLERALRGRRPPPSLRVVGVAGGRLAPGLALALAEAIHPAELVVMYGQTEATARLSCLEPTRLREAPGAVGQPIPGVEIEVVDETGRAVEAGTTGWIRARGPGTCLGYWRDPAATGEILREGWLWTRDRGSLGADGLLYHRGRLDDLVKIAGRRVDLGRLAREVETGVGAAGAAAVPFETADGAPRIALFVIGPASLAPRVRAWCRDRLPRDERPAVVEVLDRLPRAPSGKPDAAALAARARRAWRGEPRPRSGEEA